MREFKGVAVITSCAVNAEGRFNPDEYERIVNHQIEAGVPLIQGPLIDELAFLSPGEYLRALRVLAKVCKGRALSIANVCPTVDLNQALESVRECTATGVDCIKLLTPLYISPELTQDDLLTYFKTLIAATDKPVMLYNQRSRTLINVHPDTMARLAETCPQFVSVHEFDYSQVVAAKRKLGDRITIGVKFPDWLSAHVVGCEIFYSRVPYAPKKVHELFVLCAKGDYAAARKMFFDRYDLYHLSTLRPGAKALRRCLQEVGFDAGDSSGLPAKMCEEIKSVIARHQLSRAASAVLH